LVEDDAVIRAGTADMLKALGHTVLQAADAATALSVLQREAIEILVADRGLPDSSGDVFAQEALALFPGLKVIFATGEPVGLPDPSVHDAVYLIKPYGRGDLARALEQALSKPVGRKADA
jgi:DNA-binding NtrC family response regulator